MVTTFLKIENRAVSKLAAGLTDSALTVALAAGEGALFPSTYPFHISIDDEILAVTNRATDTLTFTRAAQSTSAAAHSSGARVFLNITAKSITDLNTAVNTLETYDVLTTRGDMMIRGASAPLRLAKGADNRILAMGANVPEWKAPATIMADLSGQTAAAFDFNGQVVKNIAVLQVNGATAAAYSRIGAGDTGHSLNAANDLLVTGKFEVDGMAYFDGGIDLAGLESSGAITIKPNGDADDYFSFETLSDVPTLKGVGAYLRIGDAGFTAHSLTSEDDLMVSGKLEVKGITYLDGALNLADNLFIAESASADGDVAAFGQFWVYNDQGTTPMYTGDTGLDAAINLTIFSQTATVTTASSAAEVTMFGSGVGTLTIPANTLHVGSVIRIEMGGVYGSKTTGAGTLTIRASLGGVDIGAHVETLSNNESNQPWVLRAIITVRSIGAGGTIIGDAHWIHEEAQAGEITHMADFSITGTVACDTTGALVIDATSQFSLSDADNTISTFMAVVEILN